MDFSKVKKKEWLKTASVWHNFKPPYKLSSVRLGLYKKYLKKYAPGKNILVMGATPELRDMLADFGAHVTLVDQSLTMVKTMSHLLNFRVYEKIFIKNWFSFKPVIKYDAVLGDTVLNNILSKNWEKLEKKIISWLMPEGVFITEICGFYTNTFPKYQPMDLVDKYRVDPAYFKKFTNKAFDHFCLWWRFKDQASMINTNLVADSYLKLYGHGKITRRVMVNIQTGLRWHGAVLTGKEIRERLSRFFEIKEETVDDPHPVYQNFYRLYVLKKK